MHLRMTMGVQTATKLTTKAPASVACRRRRKHNIKMITNLSLV